MTRLMIASYKQCKFPLNIKICLLLFFIELININVCYCGVAVGLLSLSVYNETFWMMNKLEPVATYYLVSIRTFSFY